MTARPGWSRRWSRTTWIIVTAVVVVVAATAVGVAVTLAAGGPSLAAFDSQCSQGVQTTSAATSQSVPLYYVAGKELAEPGLTSTKIERSTLSWQTRGIQASDLNVGTPDTITAGSGQQSVLWSPSIGKAGTTLAYIQGTPLEVGRFGGEGTLIMSAADGASRRVIRSDSDHAPSWSPNGKYLAVGNEGAVVILDSSGHTLREVDGVEAANTFSWSPNSECIVASAGYEPAHIVLADLKTGASMQLPLNGPSGYYPAWSPRGDQIVYADNTGDLMLTTLSTGSTRLLVSCPQASCAQQLWPTWSPDGTLIAFVRVYASSEQIFTVPSVGGTPRQITVGPYEHISPTW